MPSRITAAGAGQRPASLAQNPMLAVVLFTHMFVKANKKVYKIC